MEAPIHNYLFVDISKSIYKRKALRRDCIYNIENKDLQIGVSGVYLYLL